MAVRGRSKSVAVSLSVWDLNYKQTFEHIPLECAISCSDRWRVAGGMFQWILDLMGHDGDKGNMGKSTGESLFFI